MLRRRVSFHTLGCKLNFSESSTLARQFAEGGFERVAPTAEADIVIATDVIEREAREQKKSFREHLAHMLIHSVLHAQGWDHETDEEAEAMEALETKILSGLGFADPYSDPARGH